MKLEIVKFKDGSYGVRRTTGLFVKQYAWLDKTGYAWGGYNGEHIEYKQTYGRMTKIEAEDLIDLGTPV